MPKRILNRALELWRKSGKKQRIAAAVAVLALFVLSGRNEDKGGGEQAAGSGKLAVAAVPAEGQTAAPAQQQKRKNLKTITNSLGMEFALIPKGEFTMGVSANEAEAFCEELRKPAEAAYEKSYNSFSREFLCVWASGGMTCKEAAVFDAVNKCKELHGSATPSHRVRITRPYYLGKNEVTQEQWVAVMGENPSWGTTGRTLPVDNVSWDEAQEFIRRLNEKEGHQGYRLPSEAEWEYAARAGADGPLRSETLPVFLVDYIWESSMPLKSPTLFECLPLGKVRRGGSNAWGLQEMSGHTAEWVRDWYEENAYAKSSGKDPEGPKAGQQRVARLGGHLRVGEKPDAQSKKLGFRLALDPDAAKSAGAQAAAQPDKKAVPPKIETHANSIGMNFARIPAGTFQMGCDALFQYCDNNAPRHEVTISRDFWLCQYEVTREQWAMVMGKEAPKAEDAHKAVNGATWYDTQEFIKRLNEKEGHQRYRLPTEAEWEYAARAGTVTKWFFGDDKAELEDYYSGVDSPVGQKKPNPWGLYDMYSYPGEWVQDYWKKGYSAEPAVDPQGPEKGDNGDRVYRGMAGYTSSARGHGAPGDRLSIQGIRVAMDTEEVAAAEKAAAEEAAKRAEERKKAMAAAVAKIPPHTNSIGMKFMRIPAGKFMMGCDPKSGERCGDGETPKHEVAISRDYWLAKTEVTQAQWEAVMGNNPSKFKEPELPVEQVSWDDAQAFIKKLNEKEGHDRYRLPTEAEWEYAARAGSETPWFFGNDPAPLDRYAWYGTNAQGTPHPVGQKEPNPLGLYDMHGNVGEWVQDWYDQNYYNNSPQQDPEGPQQGKTRVIRGPGWRNTEYGTPEACRSARRVHDGPNTRQSDRGFRIAMDTEEFAAEKAARAAKEKAARDAAIAKIPTHTNSVGMKFMRIPAGKFQMGCDPKSGERCGNGETPKHEVTISRNFWLAKTEVTQAQWEAVMGNNPSHFKGPELPVEQVSWDDAQAFIKKLNEKEGHDRYRLPTEAEWEYAARAGSETPWFFGNDAAQLDRYAWYGANAQGAPHPVAEKEPNPWGLYDMHGNLGEWVQDWYDQNYYNNSPQQDPEGPQQGKTRVIRGPGWRNTEYGTPEACRSARRVHDGPNTRQSDRGFRIAFTAE